MNSKNKLPMKKSIGNFITLRGQAGKKNKINLEIALDKKVEMYIIKTRCV
jgi:hypothetical protein